MKSSTRSPVWVSVAIIASIVMPASLAAASPSKAGSVGTPKTNSIGAQEPVVRITLCDSESARVDCAGRVRIWRRGTGLQGTILGPPVDLVADVTAARPNARTNPLAEPGAGAWAIRLTAGSGSSLGAFPESLVIEPLDSDRPLRIAGRAYRGEILLTATARDRLTIRNTVRIEDYLCGVVPCEMGGDDVPPAALRAQAIASRTYAVHGLLQSLNANRDFSPDVDDQVYGGLDAEREAATAAVRATRGVVVLHRGVPIRANYFSTCGGETETASAVWPGKSTAYLQPVRDVAGASGPLCSTSKYYRWTESWTCEELGRLIARYLPAEVEEARGVELGRWLDLRVVKRSSSGRIAILEIRTESGRYRVFGDRIRRVLRRPDGGLLRSTRVTDLRVDRGAECRVTCVGSGWGHGVGMCQVGAVALARRGLDASQILRHYYRSVSIARWW